MNRTENIKPERKSGGLWHFNPAQNRPLIMGILNVTPDSFSDGGKYYSTDEAVERGLKMIEEGADIIDIGGESTRPGSESVPQDEQIRRVCPVIGKIKECLPEAVISIDTTSSLVAGDAVDAGAVIINDVSALRFDEKMVQVAVKKGTGLILMHMKGSPKDMQKNPRYNDIINEIYTFLAERGNYSEESGVPRNRIVVDPGIGFGKTVEGNIELLRAIPVFKKSGYPVLIGASRKSFIGKITGRDVEARLAGSVAVNCICAMNDVDILRVHDVKETVDVLKIIASYKSNRSSGDV
ncbi:MAG: dihydropteroate synthase [candidate division Zixibacteria bacterium]|nr:dihydropteroate synthase [candidate division Zixibacteria bacterium]